MHERPVECGDAGHHKGRLSSSSCRPRHFARTSFRQHLVYMSFIYYIRRTSYMHQHPDLVPTGDVLGVISLRPACERVPMFLCLWENRFSCFSGAPYIMVLLFWGGLLLFPGKVGGKLGGGLHFLCTHRRTPSKVIPHPLGRF